MPRNVRPFSIDTGNAAVDERLNNALFRVDGGGPTTDPKTGMVLLAFEYQDAGGLARAQDVCDQSQELHGRGERWRDVRR